MSKRKTAATLWSLTAGLLLHPTLSAQTPAPANPPAPPTAAAKSKAIDFALPDLDGKEIRLSQFRGKESVLVVFYRGHW